MTNPMIKIHNVSTDEIVEREMTADELISYNLRQAEAIKQQQAKEQAATNKAALLAKLGITADEVKLLLS